MLNILIISVNITLEFTVVNGLLINGIKRKGLHYVVLILPDGAISGISLSDIKI